MLTTVALIAAAYVLVGQFSHVHLLGTLGSANPAWIAVAVLGSAVTYFAAAQNLAAFVPKRLHPLRGSLVQLSTAFVGVAMPPTVGHVAVNARYLHKEGVDEGSISAAVTLSQLVNIVTTVLLLVVIGLLTGSGLSRFKIAPGANLVIGLAVIAGVLALLLSVPQTRNKLIGLVRPHLRRAWPRLLDAVSQPARLAISAGANLLLTAAYMVAFIAALRAVGAHPAILPAAVVYLAGNAVGAAAPTPGGLGGVEAVLAAGLTAMGIPAAQAISGVLVFRIATFWLPIPAGWLSYLWLQRRAHPVGPRPAGFGPRPRYPGSLRCSSDHRDLLRPITTSSGSPSSTITSAWARPHGSRAGPRRAAAPLPRTLPRGVPHPCPSAAAHRHAQALVHAQADRLL